MWQGSIVAATNSAIICIIGVRTAQTGFIPANLFCLAIYAYNVAKRKSHDAEATSSPSLASDTLTAIPELATPAQSVSRTRENSNEQSFRHRDRVRQRRLSRG